tara:strand:+ start:1031 stop:2077 length:1047 start_codon:yes stop_codon:yes gene_type:complete
MDEKDKTTFADLIGYMGGPNFRGGIDLNPAASAMLGTLTIDPIATLRDRILKQQGILEEQTRGIDINPAQYVKELEDALAAAGLDQQGNPLKEDDLSNPLLAPNPLLADEAANTGPKPLDELSPEEIMEVYKDRKIDDLIRDFPTDEGGKFPFDFVQSILINSANEGDKNAAQILMNSGVPIAGPEGAFDGDGPAAGTGDPAASGAEGTVTPTGGTPQGQTVTPQGETSTPQGGTPTPQGGTPQGGTPASDTPAVDSPNGTPTVSTGSVLDQTDTGDVTVDDQPISVPSIPMPTPRQPEKKAGMIMQISQSAPIVETLFDDILFEPKFTKLDNIPDFNLPSGLLRTLV